MDLIYLELGHDLTRLLLAVFLGGIIGLEREISNKAAGLRTNIFICVGACLFTICSGMFLVPNADPTRIAAQIVSGIGFLGAGAILRDGERVTGLTTAATIWVVAAVGMALGMDSVRLAVGTTVIVLFVQLAFTPFEIMIGDWKERHTFRILSKNDDDTFAQINEIFETSGLALLRRKLMKRDTFHYSEWHVSGQRQKQEAVMRRLLDHDDIREVTY